MAHTDRLVDYFVVVGMGARPVPVVSDLNGNMTDLFEVDVPKETEDAVLGNEMRMSSNTKLDIASWRNGAEEMADIVDLGIIFPDLEELPPHWETLPQAKLVPGMALPGVKHHPGGLLCCRRRSGAERDQTIPAVAEVALAMRGQPRTEDFHVISRSIGGEHDADLSLALGRRVYLTFRRQKQAYHNLYHEDAALVDVHIQAERDVPDAAWDMAKGVFQTRALGPNTTLSFRRKDPIGLCDYRYHAEVLEWFPEEEIDGVPIDKNSIPMFAFPSGLKIQRAPLHSAPMATFFSFVLTSGAGVCTYVACMTFYEPKAESLLDDVHKELQRRDLLPHLELELARSATFGSNSDDNDDDDDEDDDGFAPTAGRSRRDVRRASSRGAQGAGRFTGRSSSRKTFEEQVLFVPKTICVSSRLPFLRSFRTWLGQVYTLSMSQTHVPLERCIAHLMFQVPLPEPSGPPVRVRLFPRLESIDFRLPPANGLPRIEIPFRVLFECLDVGHVSVIFLSLLLERPVVLLSKYSSVTTEVAECLLALLFPMKWETIYIPRLTEATLTVLEYPGACLLGVSEEPDPFGVYSSAQTAPNAHAPKKQRSLKQKVIHLCNEEWILVDLDRNHIWCKGRGEMHSLYQTVRDVPPRLLKPLKSRWEEILTFYNIKAGAGPPPSADQGFDLAPTPDLCDLRRDGRKDRTWCEDADRRVRDAALVFLASVMQGYQPHLITPDYNWRSTGDKWFDTDAFLRDVDPKLRPFAKKFLNTQLFSNFVQFRTESSDPRFLFFDNCVSKVAALEEAEAHPSLANADLDLKPLLMDLVERNRIPSKLVRPKPTWWKARRRVTTAATPRGGTSVDNISTPPPKHARSGLSDSMLAIGRTFSPPPDSPPADIREELFQSPSAETPAQRRLSAAPIIVDPPSTDGLPPDAEYSYSHDGHLQWPALDRTLFGSAVDGAAFQQSRRRRGVVNTARVLVRTEQELSMDLADLAFYLPLSLEEGKDLAEPFINKALEGGGWGAAQRIALQFFGAWFVCLTTAVGEAANEGKDPPKGSKPGIPDGTPQDGTAIAACDFFLGVGFGAMKLLEKMDLKPDEAMYRAMIIACGRGGPVFSRDAGALLTHLKRSGVAPNAVTYGQYTQSVAMAGTVDADPTDLHPDLLLNRLLALDPSLDALSKWGKQWRKSASSGSSFRRTLSRAQRNNLESSLDGSPAFFDALAPTASVCVSTSFNLAAPAPPAKSVRSSATLRKDGDSINLVRLSQVLSGPSLVPALRREALQAEAAAAQGPSPSREAPARPPPSAADPAKEEAPANRDRTGSTESIHSTAEEVVQDVLNQALRGNAATNASAANAGAIPIPPASASSPPAAAGGKPRMVRPRVAVAALWSARACPSCAYVALDEETMQSWIEPAPTADRGGGPARDPQSVALVPCPRCGHKALPLLHIQIFDAAPDGSPRPFRPPAAPEAPSEPPSPASHRSSVHLRQGSIVKQAAERSQNPNIDLNADHGDASPPARPAPPLMSPGPAPPLSISTQPPVPRRKGNSAEAFGFDPQPGSITTSTPILHDDASEEGPDTLIVPYLSPHIVRHAVEHLVLTQGEAALHRDVLREAEPELYWNLQWYCCRFRVPLPLFQPSAVLGDPLGEKAAQRSWVAVAAWDKAAALAAVSSVCTNLDDNFRWQQFWENLAPGTPVHRRTSSATIPDGDSVSTAPGAGAPGTPPAGEDPRMIFERSIQAGPAPPDGEGTKPKAPLASAGTGKWDIPPDAARRALERFYIIHNAAKLDKIPKILKKYKGNYAAMFLELMDKYDAPATEFAAEHTVLAAITAPGARAAPPPAVVRSASDMTESDQAESPIPEGPPGSPRVDAVLNTAFRLQPGPGVPEPDFAYPLTLLDGFENTLQGNFRASAGRYGFDDLVRMLGRGDFSVNAALKYFIKQRQMRRPRYDAPLYRTLLKVVAWSGGQQRRTLVLDRRLGNNYDRPRFEEDFEEKRCFLNASERDELQEMVDLAPKRTALICRSVFGHLF